MLPSRVTTKELSPTLISFARLKPMAFSWSFFAQSVSDSSILRNSLPGNNARKQGALTRKETSPLLVPNATSSKVAKILQKSNRSSVWFIFPERKWGIGSSCYQCETQIQLNGSQMLLARESQHPRKPSNILREWILDLRTDWSSQNFQPPWECSQGKQSSVHKTSIHLSPPVYSLCPISGIILTFQPHFRHRSDAK